MADDIKERLREARVFKADRMVEMSENLRDLALAHITALEKKLAEAAEIINDLRAFDGWDGTYDASKAFDAKTRGRAFLDRQP